mgnify:CR=1 FL=1
MRSIQQHTSCWTSHERGVVWDAEEEEEGDAGAAAGEGSRTSMMLRSTRRKGMDEDVEDHPCEEQ